MSLDPRRIDCDNCGAVVEFDITQNPEALLLTLSDSLGEEVYYCPECGIRNPDNMDGVTVK